MTKRIMALLMAASMAMSCALLVSCGDSTTKAPEKNTPTQATSGTPSETPSETPTGAPTETPSGTPTVTPETPTVTPSDTPTVTPETPTVTPSDTPDVPEEMPDQETRLAKPDEFVDWLNDNDEASAKEYETSTYSDCPGGFEIWSNNFQQCILFPTVIAPVATGVGTEDYKYRFEIYYKLYDSEGSYKGVPVDVWSIYDGGAGWDNYILRIHTYSCGITDLAAKSAEEPNFYDYILCTYEIDEEGVETLVCWFSLLLEINADYDALQQKALADDAVVK